MDKNKWISNKISSLIKEGYPKDRATVTAYTMYGNIYESGGRKLPKYQAGVLKKDPYATGLTPPVSSDLQGYTTAQAPLPNQKPLVNSSDFEMDMKLGQIEQDTSWLNQNSKQALNHNQQIDNQLQKQTGELDTVEGRLPEDQQPDYQMFNPYAGVDIPTAAAFLGSSIENKDTLGIVGSSAKLGLGLARNVFGAMGRERRNNQVMGDYYEQQRNDLVGQPSYFKEGGYFQGQGLYPAYQDGGQRLKNEELLTGEYLQGASSDNTSIEKNSELEAGEHILTAQGESMEVVGKKHSQGGEEVELQDGDMVISDHLQLKGENAKAVRDMFGIKVKAKDTYATVVDKVYKKLGIDKLTKEEENVLKSIEEEEANTSHENTRNLNLQLLHKKRNKILEEKQAVEPQRVAALKAVFDLQEASKPVDDEQEEGFFQGGGREERYKDWVSNVSNYGYDGSYDASRPIEDQVGGVQTWMVKNKPEEVYNYFENQAITSKGLEYLNKNTPDLFSETGVSKPENLANLSPEDRMKLQNAYKKTVSPEEYKAFILDQFQDNRFEHRAPLMTSNLGRGLAEVPLTAPELTLRQPSYVEEEDVNFERDKRTGLNIPLLPDQSVLPPLGMQPSLKVNRRYDRVEPQQLSPEQIVQENQRQVQAAYQSAQNLPDAQRAAVMAQISSNTQNANAGAIAQTEQANAQLRGQADTQNAAIQMREQDMLANDALSYEQRTQTAQAITEEQLQQYMDYMRKLNTSNFNDVRRQNTVNQIFENYKIDSQGNILVNGTKMTPEQMVQIAKMYENGKALQPATNKKKSKK